MNQALEFLRVATSKAYHYGNAVDDDIYGEAFTPYNMVNMTASENYYRPSIIGVSKSMELLCGRDDKWRLVAHSIKVKECNCIELVSGVLQHYIFPILQ